MKAIETVAILGAGAMGAFFAARFSDAGFSTSVVARGDRYERLRRHGLVVNGRAYAVPVIHPDKAATPVDLVIVALKHHHLPEGVRDLRAFVGEGTTIISVMNGLDSEEYIGAVHGMEKMLYTVSVGIDALREENRVIYTNPGRHYFGEALNDRLSEKVRRLQAAFARAEIPCETPADMMRMMWWKFMINVGMNQASAVMRAPYGIFQSSPHARALMESLMGEVILLAKARGVNLAEGDIDDWYAVLDTLSPGGKTSMLQDIEAGRKTEVEIFAGKVVDLGKAHGVPTPVNQALLRIIHVLEGHA